MNTVFISYSHKDSQWKDRLVDQLKVIEFEGLCTLWEDGKIEVGDAWFKEIETALDHSRIIIMMVSANFLISDFIRRVEIPKILELRQKRGILVIPLIVKPCAWKEVKWLSAIQALPKGGKALSSFDDNGIDEALVAVVETICADIKKKALASKAVFRSIESDISVSSPLKYLQTIHITAKT